MTNKQRIQQIMKNSGLKVASTQQFNLDWVVERIDLLMESDRMCIEMHQAHIKKLMHENDRLKLRGERE